MPVRVHKEPDLGVVLFSTARNAVALTIDVARSDYATTSDSAQRVRIHARHFSFSRAHGRKADGEDVPQWQFELLEWQSSNIFKKNGPSMQIFVVYTKDLLNCPCGVGYLLSDKVTEQWALFHEKPTKKKASDQFKKIDTGMAHSVGALIRDGRHPCADLATTIEVRNKLLTKTSQSVSINDICVR